MARKQAEEYYLMHKDIPVCLMELSKDGTLGDYRINLSVKNHLPIDG